MNYYRWGSWLFLWGSSFFTVDALGLTLDGLTWRSACYLLGCLLSQCNEKTPVIASA